jgi:hypothetical protein
VFVSPFVLRSVSLFCVVKWQQICRSRTNCQVFFEFLAHMSFCEMSRTVRGKEQWFCRVIVVCFMCPHDSSYVYSYLFICLQTGPLDSYQCFWDLITGTFMQDRTIDAAVRWYRPKLCERKRICPVGRLCIPNGLLSTIFKVCVLLWCMMYEITQRWSRDRSPWSYLYDPRSGTH